MYACTVWIVLIYVLPYESVKSEIAARPSNSTAPSQVRMIIACLYADIHKYIQTYDTFKPVVSFTVS